jgi:hypothetical protein
VIQVARRCRGCLLAVLPTLIPLVLPSCIRLVLPSPIPLVLPRSSHGALEPAIHGPILLCTIPILLCSLRCQQRLPLLLIVGCLLHAAQQVPAGHMDPAAVAGASAQTTRCVLSYGLRPLPDLAAIPSRIRGARQLVRKALESESTGWTQPGTTQLPDGESRHRLLPGPRKRSTWFVLCSRHNKQNINNYKGPMSSRAYGSQRAACMFT